MPLTRAQHESSLEDPAVCELLKIRDFLDNVMVRTDGCYVAGFRVAGTMTYFSDDDERNEAKSVLESLLRAIPEQSMRLQFRYEVVESLNGLLELYRRTCVRKVQRFACSMSSGSPTGERRSSRASF